MTKILRNMFMCSIVVVMTIFMAQEMKVKANESFFNNEVIDSKMAFAVLTDCETGERYVYDISNKQRMSRSNDRENIFTETEVGVVIPKEDDKQPIMRANSVSQEESDGSLSWKVYIKTTYSKSGDKYLVTKTNGNWKRSDSSVKISDRRVTYGCGDTQVGNKKPTSNTFSYATGFKKYVKLGGWTRAGSNSFCYLKRGTGKKWKLEVIANI